MPARRFALLLAAIAVLGLGIRVTYILGWKQDAEPCIAFFVAGVAAQGLPEGRTTMPADNICGDALVYHDGANLVADGVGWVAPPRYLYGDGQRYESADHPPVYIAYLAAFSALGLRSVLDHQLASALLGTLTVVLVGLLGRELAGERAGLIAALGAATYVYLWINDGLVMSETAAATCVAALLLAAYRWRRSPSLLGAALVGALGGLAALTRAELLLWLPLAAVPLVIATVPEWRRRFAVVAVMAVASIGVLAPWVIRNMVTFEAPVTLSTGLGITLAYTNCDEVYSGDLIGFWYLPCGQPVPQEADQSLDERVFRSRAVAYVKAHEDRVPLVVAARVARQWNLFKPDQHTAFDTFEARERPASRVGLAQYYLMLPFAAYGVVALRRRSIPVLPLLMLFATVTFAAALTYGTTRFRVPAEVALVVLAAVGIDALLTRRSAAASGSEDHSEQAVAGVS